MLDIHAFFAGVTAQGYMVGGINLTNAFLSGGLFGYDGVHPTDLGYLVMAQILWASSGYERFSAK